MLIVETIAKIRRAYFSLGKPIKEICRELRVSRKVVRKVIRSNATEFHYERSRQPLPRIGPWRERLEALLEENEAKAARERLTVIRLFEELRSLGYEGSYAAVRRYTMAWRERFKRGTADAYVPLSFAPGEAYQFDWSHEIVVLDGATVTLKAAHVRLCHSRMMFVRTYPRETQEMVFDAHERAFAFFKGACGRGIYDNMKTAVETIFVGKDRQYNRRFLQMCSHHLVEPVACTPASGWEKGQVENQVSLVRERFFTPRLRFKSYDDLNAWLVDRCLAWAKAHAHPEQTERTIWDVFEDERPKLVPYRGRFDGFHALPASVSKTCLVRFDNNKYSVSASAVGRPVDICAYADRIVVRQDGRIVAEHKRSFGRGETIYDPWHYVPVLARKPGALRNGAPFKDWVLPAALEKVRRRLAGSNDGDRQMVKILAAALTDGLPAVEAACAQALAEGVRIEPIIMMSGAHHFNEVIFEQVFVPDENVLGEIGNGWHQVTSELSFERSGPDRILSTGPLIFTAIRALKSGPVPTERTATDVGHLLARLISLRQLSLSVARTLTDGGDAANQAAVVKDLGTRFEADSVELIADLLDDCTVHPDLAAMLETALMHKPMFTLRGGTNEVLRGIVARGMGLR